MAIKLQIHGLNELESKLSRLPDKLKAVQKVVGQDAGTNILKTKGLQSYPPATARNRPGRTRKDGSPMGYYERGQGYWRPSSGGYTNDKASETLGKKWTIKTSGWSTKIGNSATYAQYIHGDEQPNWAKEVGWLNLYDTVKDKLPETIRIFERHIQAALRSLGL